ncbi:type I-C CRISPR-associated protein Cas7/Csd2 [Stackebrandtia nassauensis]|uniref:CRISPR-associated protein, Csd2 family n=1 Tax=Stackebrandtia nassauensis (strain DSM 44728 / CIP 108903 / NRRL B-16338 / NBRC 102104 / LLR-40K-21) TaxID=446470 RepID=D3PWL8_STANL|nr:type I-C CRISPR-associated protein Cas7/Csd2 [Stackebrandtia nassauensis]ADD43240.1 CRISPR-associated protein, Csd2 family [Stackebrandtia nassauensis DSM 44728]
MSEAHLDPTMRHDAVLLFDVTDGNPNGDPDAANQPRMDDETGQGIVTDVAIKRKIRDTVSLLKGDDPRFGIFVEAGHALNTRIAQALKESADDSDNARQWICDHYFDVRMFGAVLSTGDKIPGSKKRGAGQVYGPTQLTFARSIDAISPVEHTITRVTQTKQADIDAGESTELGAKWTVPYGLYRTHLHYSAPKATKTGVTADDLHTLWKAIQFMFEHNHSAARGEMKLCGLYVFSHSSAVGDAPAHQLFNTIAISPLEADKPPRHHTDYRRQFEKASVPSRITSTVLTDLWP